MKAGETMKSRIKEFRTKKDLTQKECVKSFNEYLEKKNIKGITTATWSRWENGLNTPTEKMWNNLADFFNVDISRLKGIVLDQEQIAVRLIPIIHNSYFDTWFFTHAKSKQGKTFNYFSPELVDNIDTYITIKNGGKLPYQLYKENEIEFKLTESIFKYWYVNLQSLFEEMTKNKMPASMNDALLLNEFETILKRARNDLVHNVKRSPLTSLGFFYESEFDNDDYSENRMHEKMRALLLHGEYETAKKAVDEYFNVISSLKKQVDEFNERDYFLYRLNEIAIPIQKMNNPSKEKDEILDEISQRVNAGDDELLYFIMHRDGADLIRVYKAYKKKHNEDTTKLDKYITNPQNVTFAEMLSDKGFIKFLSEHANEDNININELYKLYLKNKE